jgi:hypothetical protein
VLLQQFEMLIRAVVQVAQGDTRAQAQIEATFEVLTAKDWMLAEPIRRIWKGERDVAALTAGIDENSARIVRHIVARLEGGAEGPHPPAPRPAGAGEGGAHAAAAAPSGERQGITLPQLLGLVEQAAGGNRELGQQLFNTFQQMGRDPNAPPELKALAGVLLHIVIGDRDPALDGLPPDLASAVRGLLGRLKQRA